MKEFIVCYTLEDDIKRERIMKDADINKEQVMQEIVEKIEQRKYFLVKGDHGDYWIDRSSIRYIGVHEKDDLKINHIKL
ncbi:hypothetical protein [Lederbergia citrea]|uniref:Uncharacterized protein n=1 Tax=Lederbergia citrea TaxID=2833581 RepID=A0A942Z4H3_9BACI|nr:hypothetical protein [Lederbergia citrea]MBS4176978.1 hypothetical protein [Lederbergia citrea]MBS4203552.1 hypothetical protein [Lederbergia citrea]MBS4221791.1 hypothetical protein [Lederbergia citrea]